MTNELQQKIQENKDKIQQLRKELFEQTKNFFSECTKELFDSDDRLKTISFTAYTPYFSDGDVCIYSAHTDDPYINGYDYYDDDYDGSEFINLYSLAGKRDYKSNTYSGEQKAANTIKSVKAFLSSFDDEFWKEFVGDHCRVTITRDNVEVDEYSHD